MSRGVLSQKQLERIGAQLPAIDNLVRCVLLLTPDLIAIHLGPSGSIPESLPCLRDAVQVTQEVRYALHEILANLAWYREETQPPNEATATFFGRFYADDAALRLYAAAEHLANFIVLFLEIHKENLEPYSADRVSLQSVVGHYLVAEKPDSPVTKAIRALAESQSWGRAIAYRNAWVHGQPPLMAGLGLVWKRRQRWVETDKGFFLGIGTGDEPEYTVDELVSLVMDAASVFVNALSEIVDILLQDLEEQGLEIDVESGQVSGRVFGFPSRSRNG